MSEFLNEFDLYHLTNALSAAKQVSWLKQNGVPFRRDGRRIIVSIAHSRGWLEGKSAPTSGGLNLAGIK